MWLWQPSLAILMHTLGSSIYACKRFLRTTINIDDELIEQARALSGVQEKTALVREGLMALIERESARRLAHLGASEPQLKPIPRRRSEPEP
jgi:Arc/MetJ family transcription regulator